MKHFVVPLDFSKSSLQALNYAVNLAAVMNAGVTMVHVYHPMPVSVDGVTVIDPDIQLSSKSRFEKLVEELEQTYLEFQVELNHEYLLGFTVEQILDFAEKSEAYMIIMGSTGSSLIKDWFGSISIEIMKKSDIPVLIVPPDTQFRLIEKIVYADDFSNNHDKGLTYIQDFLSDFLANLYCLHISTNEETESSWVDLSAMRERFIGVKIEEVDLKDKTVVHGLVSFCENCDADIIIIPSYKKGFVYGLFNKSVTREMSQKSALPMLIIH